MFFQNLEGRFQQEKFSYKKIGVHWQYNLKNPICKRSFKSHTNLQIKRNFGYVRYYLGIPSLHVSQGFPFIANSFLLCPIDFYRLCSHVYICLVVISMGPLSTLNHKFGHCLCPLKNGFYISIAPYITVSH